MSRRFRLLEPIAALTSIAAHLPAHRALTDTQNARDAFLAGPALAQRINLAAILIPYSRIAHRQPLAISRGYPFVALLDYALATYSAKTKQTGWNEFRKFAQAAARAAAAFRFLRQPNKPIAPRPVAKSGSAAGSGVAVIVGKVAVQCPAVG